ncbi:MAG: aminotransferase class I/II-fold pyridoxal phosphate-dependent enzyme [Alphaproteobacteria bacterium]|nr:aminotransferase class I/II-fold pyridoxal phosphate-dependent enzyme [Alphaproteobacteria bacterium]
MSQAVAAPYLTQGVKSIKTGAAPLAAAEMQRQYGEHLRLLNLNECPYPPSQRAIEAMARLISGVNRYPETRGNKLAQAISARTGVPAERIMFGMGSDELLGLASQIALTPSDSIVAPTPSFPRYRLSATLLGARPILVPIDQTGACDVDGLVAAVQPNTRMLYVCTPNNPSGEQLDDARLERLIARTPDNLILAVDEAYFEFGQHAGGPNVLAHLARRNGPWMVFRTFSKAYALAGLRIGYVLCGSDEIADALRKVRTTFNVTNLAQQAALAALDDEYHLKFILDSTARERKRLADGFVKLGYKPLPTVTNFVSVDLGINAWPVIDALLLHGVSAREWRDPGYETFLRVTVGTAEDTDTVLKALPLALKTQKEKS